MTPISGVRPQLYSRKVCHAVERIHENCDAPDSADSDLPRKRANEHSRKVCRPPKDFTKSETSVAFQTAGTDAIAVTPDEKDGFAHPGADMLRVEDASCGRWRQQPTDGLEVSSARQQKRAIKISL